MALLRHTDQWTFLTGRSFFTTFGLPIPEEIAEGTFASLDQHLSVIKDNLLHNPMFAGITFFAQLIGDRICLFKIEENIRTTFNTLQSEGYIFHGEVRFKIIFKNPEPGDLFLKSEEALELMQLALAGESIPENVNLEVWDGQYPKYKCATVKFV